MYCRFDIGDVLLLGNSKWHQVELIALQATTLLRWDGVKAPPAVLDSVAFCGALRACRQCMQVCLHDVHERHLNGPFSCFHAYSKTHVSSLY